MSKLLSFLGGAGTGFLEGVEKAEKNAKEEALLRVKRLTETYEKVKEENGKLTNSLKAEEDWIRTTYSDATPEQIAFLQSSPAALQAVKAMKEPTRIRLSDVIAIHANNPSAAASINAIQNAPDVMKEVGGAIKSAMPAYRRGLGGIYDQFGEQAGKTAEMRAARAMGVDVQTMKDLQPMQRPTQAGTFDATALREGPKATQDIVNQLEVDRIEAMRTNGKDSPEVAAITEELNAIKNLEGKTDKTPESRADRLMIEALDTKDPVRKKEIDDELKAIRTSIKNHKALTSTASDKEKSDTYNQMKTSIGDFVNNRMKNAKGTKWRSNMTFSTFTDERTGETRTSRVNKKEMTLDQEQEMFAFERGVVAQALKNHGYVTADGAPRTPVAKTYMDNFMITAADLSAKPVVTPPPKTEAPMAAPAQAAPPVQAAAPTSGNSVTVKGQVYNRPSGFTDAQWNEYKKAMGAAQ